MSRPPQGLAGGLAADGLVAIECYRGAVVERLTRERLECYFDLIEVLEGLAARRAAERFGQLGPAAQEVARNLREFAVHSTDRGALIELNIRFHNYIVELSGNVLLPNIRLRLQTPALRIHFPNLLSDADIEQSTEDHLTIVDAICACDGDRAEAAMRQHVSRTALISRRLPDYLFPGSKT